MRRIVRTATALALLTSVLLVGAPAHAQTALIVRNKPLQLQVSPDAGPVGTRVKVLVSQSGIIGYPSDPCGIVAVTFDGQQVAFVEIEVFDGDLSAEFQVPQVGPGAHEVQVQTSLGHALKNWFTVTTP